MSLTPYWRRSAELWALLSHEDWMLGRLSSMSGTPRRSGDSRTAGPLHVFQVGSFRLETQGMNARKPPVSSWQIPDPHKMLDAAARWTRRTRTSCRAGADAKPMRRPHEVEPRVGRILVRAILLAHSFARISALPRMESRPAA